MEGGGAGTKAQKGVEPGPEDGSPAYLCDLSCASIQAIYIVSKHPPPLTYPSQQRRVETELNISGSPPKPFEGIGEV